MAAGEEWQRRKEKGERRKRKEKERETTKKNLLKVISAKPSSKKKCFALAWRSGPIGPRC